MPIDEDNPDVRENQSVSNGATPNNLGEQESGINNHVDQNNVTNHNHTQSQGVENSDSDQSGDIVDAILEQSQQQGRQSPAQQQPITPTTNRHNLRSIGKHNLASIHSVHAQLDLNLNSRFMLLPINDQIRELQTVIRDKATSRGNFKFYADRLIRLVVEEGLNQLPIERVDVRTPTGKTFHGIRYLKGNCGVSIVRSGESMEQGLRDCCRSIRIGKILIGSDEYNQARVLYAKFPRDIADRKILLLYPIMSTGLAVIESVKVLLNHGVKEENLILLNLFSSPRAAMLINRTFSKMFVLTSDINSVCPNHFGHRYFGTD